MYPEQGYLFNPHHRGIAHLLVSPKFLTQHMTEQKLYKVLRSFNISVLGVRFDRNQSVYIYLISGEMFPPDGDINSVPPQVVLIEWGYSISIQSANGVVPSVTYAKTARD